jgi:hypothetical protein
VGRVGVNVAAEFAGQVGDRGEDAAGNDLTLDLGEPDLDLVEPGRIGRSEVKLHAGMAVEEIAHPLGFMSGEVVEDDMNLLARRAQGDDFLEEGDEVAAGVAGGGFCVHAASLGVQRGIQRKRAMPVILEAVALGPSRRERQHRVQPIESLNRGLFIEAEHGCMLRRIEYRPMMSAALRSKSGSSLAK